MKLTIFLALMALLSTSAFAVQPAKPVKKSFADKVFYVQKNDFKHWSVGIGASTLNDQIQTDIRDIKLQYNVSVQYSFNPSLYVGMKVDFRGKGKIGTNLKAGMQSAFGVFRPYLEATLDNVSRRNLPSFEKIGYNAGVSVHFVKFVVPYIELDDFLVKDQQTVAVGVTVPVGTRFYANAEYDKNVQTKGSTAVIKAGYRF